MSKRILIVLSEWGYWGVEVLQKGPRLWGHRIDAS